MKAFLAALAPTLAAEHPDHAVALALLLSDTPDAAQVREWLRRLPPDTEETALLNRSAEARAAAPCAPPEPWELEAFKLAQAVARFAPLAPWERLSAEQRQDHARRVARLARELAAAFEADAAPEYPGALALLDEATARALAPGLLSVGAADFHPLAEFPPPLTARELLARAFRDTPQPLAPMLRELAAVADRKATERRRDTRPNTGAADARAFARDLGGWLAAAYGRPADAVVAALVRLRFPDIETPPDESTVRGWRGTK